MVFLLVVVFLAAWALTLPGVPEVPFESRAPKPLPTPTVVPTVPPPTPTQIPVPTPTATPPPPTPTPVLQFLNVDHPENLAEIHGPPEANVYGSTLPRSFVVITYVDETGNERNHQVQADGNGDFSAVAPLVVGTNVLEITGYHGDSGQQARQFLQLTYDPVPVTLHLDVTEPRDGATVANEVQTVVGTTLPDARVILNDIIPAKPPDENGRWEADIVLQPGSNEIQVTASRGEERLEATITVTYEPGS